MKGRSIRDVVIGMALFGIALVSGSCEEYEEPVPFQDLDPPAEEQEEVDPPERLEQIELDHRFVETYEEWSVEFDVSSDVQSITFTAEASPSSADVYAWRIWGPGGELLFDLDSDESVLYITPYTSGGQMGILLPNTPTESLQPGRYLVELWADSAAEVKINVIYKRGVPTPQGGRLRVNLWFTDQDTLDASKAQVDSDFQEAIAVVKQIFDAIEIEIVISGYHEIGGTLGRSLAVPRDSDQACAQIRELPRVHDGPAVNLVLIDHDNFDWGPVLGLSCGAPGAPLLSNISASGVMVALDYLRDNPGVFGDTIVHEIGHYLGLYHTSEADGHDHDPLPDTPECRSSQDLNGDGVLSAEECRNHGGDNNMFWTGFSEGAQQLILTPHQRFVIMNNPVVESD